jgi:hypothetical protein
VEYINIDKVVMALPKNRHNLVDPLPYISYFDAKNISYNIYEAEFSSDKSRTLHSKLLYLKSSINYLLIGSPNITRSALLKNGEMGNIECAILLKGKSAESLIKDIDLVEIKDINRFKNLDVEDKFDSTPKCIKIFWQNLTILTDPCD